MSHDIDASSVPYLQVYKDGQLVDTVCLQGRDRWIAGRHADCHIWVGHASTSRRHLEIQVLHATQELLLLDLHSAHGTRVNGEAVTSGSSVVVKQDDTVQMGASTRSYRVDWVQSSEAGASVLERSSPNGSKASFRYKLGNIQGAKKPAKKESSDPSPTRAQGQRGAGRPELPPRTPARRFPFANVQASTLNMRSPQPHSRSKASTPPENLAPFKVMEDSRPSFITKEAQEDRCASPSFWLRRCSSAPIPTAFDELDGNEVDILPESRRECSGDPEIPSKGDEYPSDKENWQPGNTRRKSLSWDGKQSCRSSYLGDDRQPFAVLQADSKPVFPPSPASSPESDIGSRRRSLGLPPPQRPATSALVNNLDSLFGKLKLGELRRQWHIVVDTNCLLDTDALKSLKQLEGIRETRIIVPKIVLRELDGLKRRRDIGHSAREALKWIEDCMQRIPFWMHVQRSTETLPVHRTAPPSHSRNRSFSVHRDKGLMAPTNDDHILDCALLFDRRVTEGRVVLLTRDTALKIKAIAEGMLVEEATSFCESLMSPYSERFLWLGSTVYRSPAKKFTGYDESHATAPSLSKSPFSISSLELRSKKKASPEAKGHGKHGVEEFRCHYSERPQGLQVVLA